MEKTASILSEVGHGADEFISAAWNRQQKDIP
jgi:hypothetical protein